MGGEDGREVPGARVAIGTDEGVGDGFGGEAADGDEEIEESRDEGVEGDAVFA